MGATYRKILMLAAHAACLISLLLSQSSPSGYVYVFADGKRQETKRPYPKKGITRASDMAWVKLQRQFPGAFLTNGPRSAKRIALTFDDAPDARFTPAILDVLAEYDVCATFFVVGARAASNPTLVQRIHLEGHIIGNHSYDHAVMSKLTLAQYRN